MQDKIAEKLQKQQSLLSLLCYTTREEYAHAFMGQSNLNFAFQILIPEIEEGIKKSKRAQATMKKKYIAALSSLKEMAREYASKNSQEWLACSER